jgi:hypothetical protein
MLKTKKEERDHMQEGDNVITRIARCVQNGGAVKYVELDDVSGGLPLMDAIVGYDHELKTFFTMFDADPKTVCVIGTQEGEFPNPPSLIKHLHDKCGYYTAEYDLYGISA